MLKAFRQPSTGPDAIIGHLLRVWAREYRRILRGGIRYPDGSWHVDGWPPLSPSGKLKDEAEGASQGRIVQYFAEVYSLDALVMRQAMVGMPEDLRTVIILRYVVQEQAKACAESMDISRARYFQLLESAHSYLRGRLDASQSVNSGKME